MAGNNSKASGELNWNLNINTAGAFTNLNQILGLTRTANKEWRNEYNILMANNKAFEANQEKIKGLREERKRLNNAREQANIIDNNSKKIHDADVQKVNQLNKKQQDIEVQLKRNKEQLKSALRIEQLNSEEVNKARKQVEYQNKTTRERVQLLKNQGREEQANQERVQGYSKIVDAQTKKVKALQSSLKEYVNSSDLTPEKLSKNDKYYQQRATEIRQAKSELVSYQNAQKDSSLGLANINAKAEQYDKTTKSLVERLKQESGQILANKESFDRLSRQRQLDIQQYDAQAKKMQTVERQSGRNSIAYQEEQQKLNEVAANYSRHSSQLNEVGTGYQNLNRHTAKSLDATNRRMKHLNQLSSESLELAHRMSTGSVAVGGAFVYGAQQAADLQNTFVKTSNLMTTAGEDQEQVLKNSAQMQSDTKEYAIEYGQSAEGIAKGYEELTRRGYDSNQALASQKTYLEGAIASGSDYESVVRNGAAAIESFGMKSEDSDEMFENTKKTINQMSYAADLTASDFDSMGHGLRYVGSTAASTQQSIAQTTAALGELANNGQTGSVAGTGLRKVMNSFNSISDSPKSGQYKVLNQLGLSKDDFRDSEGNMKSLTELFETLQSRMGDVNKADQAEIFHKLFGTTGQEAARILANNVDGMKNLNDQIEHSQDQGENGYITDLSKSNMESSQNQFNRFRESMKAVNRSFSETLLPTATQLADKLANIGDKISNMPSSVRKLAGVVGVSVPVIAGLGYVFSGITRSMYAYNKIKERLLIWSPRNNFQRVERSINEEKKAYDKETSSIKRNSRAKRENSGISGPTSNYNSSDLNNYNNNYSMNGNRKTNTSSSRNERNANSTVFSRGASKAGMPKLSNTLEKGQGIKASSPLLSTAGKAAPILGGLTSFIGADKNNVGNGLGATAGGALGAAIPIPGLNIAASLGGSYLGGKIGSQIQEQITKFVDETKNGVKDKTDKIKPSEDDNNISNTINDTQSRVNNRIQPFSGSDPNKNISDKAVNDSVDDIKSTTDELNKYYDNKEKKSSQDLKSLKNAGILTNEEYENRIKRMEETNNQERKSFDAHNDKMVKAFNEYKQKNKQINDYWNQKIEADESVYGKNSSQAQQSRAKREEELLANSKQLQSEISKNEEKTINQLTESLHKVTGRSLDIEKTFRKNYNKNNLRQNNELVSQAAENARQRIEIETKSQRERGKQANQEYKDSVEAAKRLYTENHAITEEEYKDAVQKAKDKRNGVLSEQQKQVQEAIDNARQQYEGVISYNEKGYKDTVKHAESTYNETISNAAKTRDEAINKAYEQHQGTSQETAQQRNEAVGNAIEQYVETVDKAGKTKNESIEHAEEKKREVNRRAQEERNGIKEAADGANNDVSEAHKTAKKNSTGFWDTLSGNIADKLTQITKQSNSWNEGMKSLLSQFGGGTKIKGVEEPKKYSTGTGLGFTGARRPITKDTLAMLNDGPQTDNRELAFLPNGQMFSPEQKNWTGMLPKGTEILNANDTKKYKEQLGIERFASGTGTLSNFGDKAKEMLGGAFGGLKEKAKSISDMFKNRDSAFDSIFTGLNDKIDNSNFSADLVDVNHNTKNTMQPFWQSSIKQMKDALDGNNNKTEGYDSFVRGQLGNNMFKYIGDKLGGLLGANNPKGTNIERWESLAQKALKQNGFEGSGSQTQKILQMIQRESGGNPNAVNLWDSNAKAGNPSKGLAQTIQSTFDAYKFNGRDNIMNGYDNMLAAINYAQSRYGRSDSMFDRVAAQGYENGGLSNKHKLAEISEGNKSEMVLPLTDKSRAVQLIMKSLDYMFGQEGQNSQSNNSNNEGYIRQLVEDNQKKDVMINKMLDKMDILIDVIQNKPTISDTNIFEANKRQNQKQQRTNNLLQGGF